MKTVYSAPTRGETLRLLGTALLAAAASTLLSDCGNGSGFFSTQFAPPAPQLVLSPNSVAFGQRSIHSFNNQVITVTNNGNADAQITGLQPAGGSFSFKGQGAFPGLGGSCRLNGTDPSSGLVKANGGSCTFIVTAQPQVLDEDHRALSLTYQSFGATTGAATVGLDLSVSGLDNANLAYGDGNLPYDTLANASTQVYHFGDINQGSPLVIPMFVMYAGVWDATDITFNQPPPGFNWVANQCSSAFINVNCAVSVQIATTSLGPVHQTVSISYNDGGSEQQAILELDGNIVQAATPAVLAGTPASWNAGPQIAGAMATQEIQISRSGTMTATQVAVQPFTSGAFQLLRNGCSATVTGPCTLQIGFQPPATGTFHDALVLQYNNGVGNTSVSIPLTGSGVTAAVLALQGTPPVTAGFGTVSVNDQEQLTFTLVNNAPASTGDSASGVTVTVENGIDLSVASNGCNAPVPPGGGTCQFSVIYHPHAPGSANGQIRISYWDGAANQMLWLPVTAAGTALATLRLDNPAQIYPPTIFNTVSNHTFTVHYFGLDPASIKGFTGVSANFYYAPSFPGTPGSCGNQIQADCTLTVQFAPLTSTGPFTPPFSIQYDPGDGSQKTLAFQLSGTGVPPASLAFDTTTGDPASPFTFPSVSAGMPEPQTFGIHNQGGYNASVLQFASVTDPFRVQPATNQSPACQSGGVIPPGVTCYFTVTFQPMTAASFSDSIAIDYFDGVANQSLGLSVSGTGLATPQLVFQSASQSFAGFIGHTTGPVPLTLIYYGTGSITVTPTLTGADYSQAPAAFPNGGTCPNPISAANITPGSSCTTEVYFTPHGGSSAGSLTETYAGGSTTILFNGTGTQPALLTIAPTSHDFGVNVAYGDTARYPFQVTNTGQAPASAISFVIPALPITIAPGSGNDCTSLTSLAGGASCNFVVQFQPTAANPAFSGQVVLDYFDATTNQNVSTAITGTGSQSALLRFALASQSAGNAAIGGSPATLAVQLDYFGQDPATGVAVTAMPAGFALAANQGTAAGDCPAPPAAISANCLWRVQFTPATSGLQAGTFQLTYTTTGPTGTAAIALSGTGQTPASLAIAPSPNDDFGTILVNTYSVRTLTVTNSGQATAKLSAPPGLPAPFQFLGGTFPGNGGTCTLSIGSSCLLVVQFSPIGAGPIGPVPLTLNYDSGPGTASQQVSVGLTGTAYTQAALSIVIANGGAFGELPVNGSANTLVTISNHGTQSATAISVAAFGAPFSITGNTCGASLAVAASCTFQAVFHPSLPGSYVQNMQVSFNDGQGNQSISATLQGAGTTAELARGNGNFSCARTSIGSVKCWGFNNLGQLGLGDTTSVGGAPNEMGSALPAVDLGLVGHSVIDVQLGNDFACALIDDGSVRCWGNNSYGQLGVGSLHSPIGTSPADMGSSLQPVDLGTGRTATAIALGLSHACALLDDASLKCWGLNQQGQLGLGDTLSRGSQPSDMGDNLPAIALGTGRHATAVSANADHTCALLDNGSVKCWGNGFYGELGQGNDYNSGDAPGEMGDNLFAIALGTGRTAIAIAAGGGFTCAVLDNGGVKCWGKNADGNLGYQYCRDANDNQAICGTPGFDTPSEGYGIGPNQMGANLPYVNLGTGVTALAIAAGRSHVCAILSDHGVKCWGDNSSGQLGQGDTNPRGMTAADMQALTEVNLGTGRTATAISVGQDHSCADLDDGTVKCWGQNTYGDLGNGNEINEGSAAGQMGDALSAIGL
jgi:alpha-tubulin suppressor-like RCC1 family protein